MESLLSSLKRGLDALEVTCTELTAVIRSARPISKNAAVARSGYNAETIFCRSPAVWAVLSETYFHKRIAVCKKMPGNTKSDVHITFEDTTTTTAQIKNGNGGRHSVNRLPLHRMPVGDAAKRLLATVCLKAGGERISVPMERSLVRSLLMGADTATMPQHFFHTTIVGDQIDSLEACPAAVFLETLEKDLFPTFLAKRTGVHLSPLLYLQRKGGGKTDSSPDDIQAKLTQMPECMIPIALRPQTTS